MARVDQRRSPIASAMRSTTRSGRSSDGRCATPGQDDRRAGVAEAPFELVADDRCVRLVELAPRDRRRRADLLRGATRRRRRCRRRPLPRRSAAAIAFMSSASSRASPADAALRRRRPVEPQVRLVAVDRVEVAGLVGRHDRLDDPRRVLRRAALQGALGRAADRRGDEQRAPATCSGASSAAVEGERAAHRVAHEPRRAVEHGEQVVDVAEGLVARRRLAVPAPVEASGRRRRARAAPARRRARRGGPRPRRGAARREDRRLSGGRGRAP